MLNKLLNQKQIILASASPRRQQLLKSLGIDFKVVLRPVNEVYSLDLKAQEITEYLAILKTKAFENQLNENDILITSDTLVWHRNKALGKPKNYEEAFRMLKNLSKDTHQVYSSVCFTTRQYQKTITSKTMVYFKELYDSEIDFYLTHYKPYDKAGAYGIQEWMGKIAVEKIEGSYTNVMGLPTQLVYKTLTALLSEQKNNIS